MKIITQTYYPNIQIGNSEMDIIQIVCGYDAVPIERENIQKLIDTLAEITQSI